MKYLPATVIELAYKLLNKSINLLIQNKLKQSFTGRYFLTIETEIGKGGAGGQKLIENEKE